MKELEVSAKTVELAIDDGLTQLGVSRDDVDIEVLSTGGLFSKAKVKLTLKSTVGDKGRVFLEGVLKILKIGAFVDVTEDEEEALLNIVGNDVSEITGGKGEVFDALQYLVSLVANKDAEEYKRVLIDSEDFRAERIKRLEELALVQAEKAISLARRIRLDAMNPFQRRVIHAKLQSYEGVKTISEGNEPYRYVVIVPNNAKPYEPRNRSDNRGGYNRDRNNNDRRNGGGGGARFARDGRSGGGDRDGRSGGGDNSGGYNRDRNNTDRRSGGDNRNGGYNRDRNDNRGASRDGGFGSSGTSMRSSGFSTGTLIKRNEFDKEKS